MKTGLFRILLVTLLALLTLTGCQAESLGRTAERGAEAAGDALKQTAEATVAATGKQAKPALTLEEAQSIALKHAGFAEDQVTALHTEYEIERGIAQYDVEFHHGSWEYDYEIQADTGEILSYNKDD